jgi:hypothetical protein
VQIAADRAQDLSFLCICLNKPGELESAPKRIPGMEFADLVDVSANTRAVSGEICRQENSGGGNGVD